MGAASGPDMITDGLVLCLDAGSRASYSVTNILSYWTEYAGRAVHYEVLNAYSVKLKNTFNSWVGYYPATITSTGRYTITFTYYSDTNGSSLYLDNDGVMDNIYNNYTLTANIASQTYTTSVDINTTGAINFYFMRFSGGNIFITDVNFYKSDTIWTDLAGSNNGTLTNGPTFSNANAGSIVLDGVNDVANLNTIINSSFTELTCEILFKSPIAGNSNTAFLIWDHLGGSAMWLGKTASNQWFWMWNYGPGLAKWAIISSTSYVANTWIHIAVRAYLSNSQRIVETNNFAQIIVNGNNYSNSHRNDDTSTLGYPSQSIAIGQRGSSIGNGEVSGAPSYTSISVASFKIYNRALTPAEIQQNYNAIKGRFGI